MGLSNKEPKKIKRAVVFFNLFGDVIRYTGEEDMGVVHIPGHGGVAILRASTVLVRSGAVRRRTNNPNHAALMRERRHEIWVREGDPTPLSLGAGRVRGYQAARLTKELHEKLDSEAVDIAIADHKRYGAGRDELTRLLLMCLALSIVGLVVTWALMVPIVRIING